MNLFRVRWLLLAGGGVVIALVIAVAIATFNAERASLPEPSAIAVSNQDINPGSPAGDIPAPDFELRDQTGRLTSLAQMLSIRLVERKRSLQWLSGRRALQRWTRSSARATFT